jgi:uncharacterized damage-inducible protein DinB
MKRTFVFLFALLLLAGVAPVAAQQAPPAAPIGVKPEFFRQFDDAEKKLVALAEAIPAENYAWRPMEGVRSMSEVFMHVSAGCYGFANALGTPPPEGVRLREMEKSATQKEQVVAELKKALAHFRAAAEKIPDDGVEKEVAFRRRQAAIREVLFSLAVHLHEHLGQAIAYARANKVTPPWSAGN